MKHSDMNNTYLGTYYLKHLLLKYVSSKSFHSTTLLQKKKNAFPVVTIEIKKKTMARSYHEIYSNICCYNIRIDNIAKGKNQLIIK